MDMKTIQHVFACYNATNFEENNFEVFEYSHNETFVSWYDKCRILDAYAHPAFRSFSKNAYKNDASNGITDTIIIPFLGAVGILGNIGGIISFFRKTTLTYYLLLFFLAISDLTTILAFIFYYSFPNWIHHDTLLEYLACSYVILISYCLLHSSQLVGTYLVICLSIERYCAICRPLAYRARRTYVLTYIVPVLIFSIGYSIPIFCEHNISSIPFQKIVRNEGEQLLRNTTIYVIVGTGLKSNENYQIAYETVCKLIVKCIIPYCILITTNVLIVRGFITSHKALQYVPENNEVTESSDIQTRCTLRLHTSHKGARRRRLNVNLGILNLGIAVVFLLCYSLIWLWVVFDLYRLIITPMPQVPLFYQL